MAEREGLTHPEIPVRRNADEIRLDIATERQMLAQTVDQLGVRLQEKFEWRNYVRHSPYLALGAAAGVGLLASGVFARRSSPLERLINSAGKPLSKARKKSLIKTALWTVTTKAATAWLENAVSEAIAHRAPEARSSWVPPDSAEPAR